MLCRRIRYVGCFLLFVGECLRDADVLQSGKILRKIMREKAKAEVGDKDPVQAKL